MNNTEPTERFQIKSIRFENRDVELLKRLADKWRCSLAAAVRRAVALAAEQEGID